MSINLLEILNPSLYDLINAAISNVNFSTISVILLGLIIYMVQMSTKRQEKSDVRYDNLVKTFIDTTKKLSETHDDALNSLNMNHEQSMRTLKDSHEQSFKDMIKELNDLKNELKICGLRIEEQSRLYVFNHDRK
jgi:hypothetical protein